MYYGNYLNDFRNTKTQNTIECQQLCQNWSGPTCRFWSFDKVFGKCHLSKDIKADVFKGNNENYASGSRDCTVVVR